MKNNKDIKTINKFNKWADSYDKGIWSRYFNYSYKKIIETIEPYLVEKSKILDIGCGTGGLIVSLSYLEPIEKLIGIDISEKMIEKANVKKEKLKLGDKVKFLVEDTYRTSFQDNTFDIIFSLNSFHHYADALKEIGRILKKGGLFVLVDNFSGNILRRIWIKFLKIYFKEDDAKYYNKEELNNILIKHNLKVLEQKTLLYFILISVCKKEKTEDV